MVGGLVCDECCHEAGYDIDKDLTTLLKYLYLIKLEKVDDQFLLIMLAMIKL